VTRSIACYLLAALLVIAYVNTFRIWQLLQMRVGEAAAGVPWMLAALLFAGAMLSWRRLSRRARPSLPMLAAALCAVLAGMLIADPDFPAKRVHVPEYAALAAIVWLALKAQVSRDRLVLLTVLVAGLFGVHDEFLQALHAERSFGLRDMAVNLCGAAAGTLVLAALSGHPFATAMTFRMPATVAAGAVFAAAGLALYLFALSGLAVEPLPYWPALPMLAGAFALAVALAFDRAEPGLYHAGTVIVLLLLLLSIYPVIANETPLHFA
jgi:uncharacterized protein YfiM (DUF2279 family)